MNMDVSMVLLLVVSMVLLMVAAHILVEEEELISNFLDQQEINPNSSTFLSCHLARLILFNRGQSGSNSNWNRVHLRRGNPSVFVASAADMLTKIARQISTALSTTRRIPICRPSARF